MRLIFRLLGQVSADLAGTCRAAQRGTFSPVIIASQQLVSIVSG
jgi:hypothetical protein